jgi:hypothetical protein
MEATRQASHGNIQKYPSYHEQRRKRARLPASRFMLLPNHGSPMEDQHTHPGVTVPPNVQIHSEEQQRWAAQQVGWVPSLTGLC